jgi:L-malate glycosyltransferase
MLHWAALLAEKGLRVYYISNRPVHIHRVQSIVYREIFASTYAKFLFNVAQVRKLLGQIKPALLHSYYLTNFALLAALSKPPRLVVTVAGSDLFYEPKHHYFFKLSNRFVFGRAQLLHSVAQHMTSRLRQLAGEEKQIITLPEGIDPAVFPAYKDQPHLRSKIVLSARALSDIYDVKTLLHAIPLVLQQDAAVRFIIAGDGPEKNSLMTLAQQMHIAHAVHFVGKVSWSALAEIMGKASIYVTTSPSDGMSATLLQAMMSGLLPVVSDIAANREWIEHEVNGLVFPCAQAPELARAILLALQKKPEHKQWAEMNKTAVLAKGIDAAIIAQLIEYYKNLI